MQRIFFILIGLTCLAGAIQGPGLRGRRIYSVLVFLLARRRGHGRPPGMVADRSAGPTAGLPAQPRLHDAGASFQEVIRLVLHGTADCAQVSWTLFTLSIPEWSLLAFVAYLGFSIVQFLRRA